LEYKVEQGVSSFGGGSFYDQLYFLSIKSEL